VQNTCCVFDYLHSIIWGEEECRTIKTIMFSFLVLKNKCVLKFQRNLFPPSSVLLNLFRVDAEVGSSNLLRNVIKLFV